MFFSLFLMENYFVFTDSVNLRETTTKIQKQVYSNSVLQERQEQGVRVETQTVRQLRHFLDPRGNLCHRECVLVEQDTRSCHTHKMSHLYFLEEKCLIYCNILSGLYSGSLGVL